MAYQPFDLTGKVALVTGGNSGIGLGMARACAEAGADIAIWGTNAAKNEAARASLAGTGRKILTLECDVGDEAAVDAVATGQVFTARQAQAAGLVDRIGFLEDAVDRAVELAGLTKETARVVRYVRPRGVLDELLGLDLAARSAGQPAGRTVADAFLSRSVLDAFVEWTTPRAWYLCSWWPALLSSGS